MFKQASRAGYVWAAILAAALVWAPAMHIPVSADSASARAGRVALAAYEHLITNIRLDPPTPNILALDQHVDITFDYATSEAGGVRIFARPMAGAATAPGYAAHGSGLYPVGSGSGSGYFTITAGEVTVDRIRFRITDAEQTTLLGEFFIPVHYQFSGSAHRVSNIRLDPPSPNILGLNQHVDITFDYATTEAGGVRIFARPMAGAGTAPGYAAHGSGLYPVGSGSGGGYFTITSGEVTVDRIRFQITNGDQSAMLAEWFIPIHLKFGGQPHGVRNIRFDPPTPNILAFDQNVDITFDYTTTEQGGVRIFARPWAGGAPAPHYAAHGSGLYPVGSGSGGGYFTITSGDVTVDQTRLRMLNAEQSALLYEAFLPTHYQYGYGTLPGRIVFLPVVLTR